MFDTLAEVEWRRGWTYTLRWTRGHTGVISRAVYTPAQLRAVVEWARANPHIEKCSYKITWELVGKETEKCPAGHSLLTPVAHQPYRRELRMRQVECRACPGHYRTICPECGAATYDPPLTPGCGPLWRAPT